MDREERSFEGGFDREPSDFGAGLSKDLPFGGSDLRGYGACDANRVVVEQVYGEVWEGGNLDLIDSLVDENYVDHAMGFSSMPGREGMRKMISDYRRAFPDLEIEIKDIICEGDRVVTVWEGVGTHRGEFMGVGPTDRSVRIKGMSMVRISDGKLIENWSVLDLMGLMEQLGADPVACLNAISRHASGTYTFREDEPIWS